ncbi:hypothetical protein CBR_g70700 [Chara braunii]|uniref:Reverse transcriptase domain-containing protein n=1 Tax=Chara braunii TaxID=69332 RepID=A0A388K9T3_CHABU|nr:hypothetical protein CBR_g70700 [Chara braunii]|eukprot:GBG66822.1 hypothetical protein CBR_g70700 [Chara braunii]
MSEITESRCNRCPTVMQLSINLNNLQVSSQPTAKAQQEAAEAEHQRLAQEAAAQAQRIAEADAMARDKRNAASTEALIQTESQWTALQGMIFVPTGEQADPTQTEAARRNLANLMLSMMRAVMWNNTMQIVNTHTGRQLRQTQQQESSTLTAAIRAATQHQQQQQQLLASTITCVNSIEAKPSAAPGFTTDIAKQLGERIDHAVTIIGDLGDFTSLASISSTVAAIKTDITKLQERLEAASQMYKMPRFNIGKFDDYNKTDALAWWHSFITEAACHQVPDHLMMTALYLQLIGGAHAFMNHLATNLGTTIADLHKHITWEQLDQAWHTRFMVRNVVKAAMNEVYTSSQGNMSTRDWTIKWQKIGILDRAKLVIQTDDKDANERQSQPQYVAKQGDQRPAHNNAVIADGSPDLHAAAASSTDGGVVAALPPKRPKRVRKNKATQGITAMETGEQPWKPYNITKEVFELQQRVSPVYGRDSHFDCLSRGFRRKVDAIAHNNIEEMGVVFLHALPSTDGPAALPPDPHITHLLDGYGDVFEAPTGTVSDRPIRHRVTLETGVVPPRGCIYCMSEEELEVLRAQLVIDKGWIHPSCSPYGAPVLFVRKKNKDLRLCIDYRKLNVQNVNNVGPLPQIDDLLERLGGGTYFSKLDLKSGYHQIEIQPQDRYKTAFKTWYGHFEWVVMPFGLTNVPTTFEAAMTTKFRDLLDRTVLIYLDDILVYSRTLDEHVVHLPAVLNRLRAAKYKANRDKCEFAKQELEYLNHYVTRKGIRPLAEKIQAIVDWPEPRCTTDVRSFMGLAGYYQRFVKSYSKVAAPLSRLQAPKEYDLDNVMDEEVNFPSAKVEEILSTLTAQPARRPEPSLVDIYEGIEDEPEIGPGIWRSESGTSLISVSSQGEEPLTPHSIGSRGSIPGTPGSVGGRHIIPGCIRPSAVKGSPDPWSEIPPLFLDGYDLSTTTKGLVGTVSAASKPPRLPERELKTREDSKSMISDPKTRADTKRVFDMKGGLSLKPIPDLNATSIRRTFPELKSGSPPYKKGGSMVKGELDSRMVSEQEAVGVKRTFSELKSGLTSGPTEQSTHVSGPDGLAPTDHFHASEFRDDTSKDLKGQKTGVSAMQLAAAFGGVRTASPISIPKKKKSTPQVTPSDSPSSSASDGVSYLNMKLKLKPTGFFHKPHPMDRHPMGVGAGSESKHMVTGEGPDSNAVTRAQMERQTIPSSVTEVESNVLTQDQGDTDGNMLRDGPEDVLPTPEVSDFNMDILSEKDQAINKDDGKEVEPGVMAKQIVSGIRVSSPPHPMFRGSEENHWGASMSESVFETQSNDVFTPVDDGQSVDNDEMLEQNEEVSLSFNECLRTEDNDGTTIKNYDDLGVVDSHTEIRPAAGQQITLALSPVCAPAVPDLEVEELLLDQVQRTADGSMVDHSCQSQDNPSIECVPEAIEPDFVIAKQLTHSEAASVEATMANVVAAEGAVLDVTDGAGLLDEQQGAGGTKLETDKNMHPPSSTIDEESVHSTVLDVVAGEEQVLERQQGGEVRTVVEEKDADSTQESLMESVNEGMMFSKDMELEERGEKDHQESSADSSIAPSTLVNPSALQLQGETTQPLETREQSCQVGERDTKKMPVPWGSIAAVAAAGLGIVLTIVNRARQDQHHSFGGLHMAEYRIQQGDTLSKISRELGYTRWQEIAQINPDVKNPNIIFPNDVLRVSP